MKTKKLRLELKCNQTIITITNESGIKVIMMHYNLLATAMQRY